MEEWNDVKKDYDDFTRSVLEFMRDNHGFDYLNKIKHDPFQAVVLMDENEEVRISRGNCTDFLATNQKLIRKAVERNRAHPELPPIDIISYFIQLEKELYQNALRFPHVSYNGNYR